MSTAGFFQTAFGRLRTASVLDGLSFVVLMGIGMPLKYMMNEPIVVRVTGPLHGFFFVWLCYELAGLVFSKGWPAKKAALVFLCALVPTAPFFLDAWLKKQELPVSAPD